MGKRGTKNTPTELRVVRGNPSGRPMPEGEIKAEKVEEKAEPPMKLNKRELVKWDRITGNLQAVGLLTVMDVDMLARYCKKLARYDVLSNHIEKHGTIVQKNNQYGPYDVSSPEYNQWMKLNSELVKIECQFGFSPSSRSGIIGPLQDETKDEWEGFLFGQIEKAKKKA